MCGEVKPLDGYHRDANAKDGRVPRCKPCTRVKAREGYISRGGAKHLTALRARTKR